jgi:putative phosphoesterase
MRIGLISDTHGLLRPEVFQQFAGVERILHAGDVGSMEVLAELALIAPVTAVPGNTDGFEIRARLPEVATLELAGQQIVVIHGDQFGRPTPFALRVAYPKADIIVYGHTHRPLIDRADGKLVINPGAAGPRRFELRPSVGILVLGEAAGGGAEVEIVEL